MSVECAQLPIPQGKKAKSERSEEENRRNSQEKERQTREAGKVSLPAGREAGKTGRRAGEGELAACTEGQELGLSSSVRKIPVFFLGCLVSWLKISEPNGALGTERWRGM